MNNKYYTTQELANILGISRIAVFNRIKSGKIKAQKIGRNYVINKDELNLSNIRISSDVKRKIDEGVSKALKEYGDVFKKLGKE